MLIVKDDFGQYILRPFQVNIEDPHRLTQLKVEIIDLFRLTN